MKFFYLLIIIPLFTFCKSDRHLKGIWIGSYEVHYSQSNFFPHYGSMRYLIEFDENTYTAKKFDFPIYDEKEDEETHSFKKDGYILLKDLIHSYKKFGYDTLEIKSISSNHLVLKTFRDYGREFVFKKIVQENSPSIINLLGKTFILQGKDKEGEPFIDSLDFINDSILFHLGKVLQLKYTHWAINHYKDLSFLLISYNGGVPFLLKEKKGTDLILSSYDREPGEFELKEINYSYNLDKLYGSWQEDSRILDGKVHDPLPLVNMDKSDQKMKLTIKKDSLTINQYKRSNTYYWEANTTNELVFVPELDHFTHPAIWKIQEVGDVTFKMEKITRFSASNEIETIIFHRMEIAD